MGVVFESSHVPLKLWLQAFYLICSSKKNISSHQLMRTLGVQYKTVWSMMHRIREAMRSCNLPMMGGEGSTIEIYETSIGMNDKKPGGACGFDYKIAVIALVHRDGFARSSHVDGKKAAGLLPIIKANVAPGMQIMND